MNLFLAIVAAIVVTTSAGTDYSGPFASYSHPDDRYGPPVKLWGLFTPGPGCPKDSPELPQLRLNVIDKGSVNRRDYVQHFKHSYEYEEICNDNRNPDDLSNKGVSDITAIAKRLKRKFPAFFPSNDEDLSKFIFASDGSLLSETSRHNFLLETVDVDSYRNRFLSNNKPDSMIFTLADLCPLMKRSLTNRSPLNDALSELEHKYSAPTIEKALRAINSDTGLSLDMKRAKIIYDALGSEAAASQSGQSIWEKILNDIELLQILEYMKDLELYYTSGYAIEQNYKPICLVYRQMIAAFENDQAGEKGVFYFGSREILLRMLTHLQLYKDVQGLRTDHIDPNRQWRSKNIAGFASNIVYGLFLGTDGIHYVVFYHQEREVPIPGCGPPCTFQKFKELYGDQSKCIRFFLCDHQ